MLTGDNSILQKATEAKSYSDQATAKEKVQLEVLGNIDKDGTINVENLKSNLEKLGATVTGSSLPLTVTLDGFTFTVEDSGNVKLASDEVVVEAKVNDANPGVLEVSGDTYTINCIEDLVAFAYDVNNNNNLYEGKIVTLGCDLDFQNDNSYMDPTKLYAFNGKGYFEQPSGGTAIKTILTDESSSPVGWASIGKGDNDGFAGTFDGNNHTLSNLYMKPFSYGGLFGKTNNAITIKNLGIVNCNISSYNEVGGILGYADQNVIIVNCYCTGNIERVNTNGGTGGLLGDAQKGLTIINCYNLCALKSKGDYVGGLVGHACQVVGNLKILNSFNCGNVTSTRV